MNNKFYLNYYNKYNEALKQLQDFYNENSKNSNIREMIHNFYKDNNLDPDGCAIRFEFDILCSADGLHSIKRICDMEPEIENIIKTYKEYRKYPIFFFPRGTNKILGINRKRASVFGDRIDYTLYDIKKYYTKDRNECRLLSEFEKDNTSKWLDKMGSFENIIDWYGVKGIFTDDNYEVYDLETNGKTIESYKDSYSYDWTNDYYNNLKNKITMFYDRHNIR